MGRRGYPGEFLQRVLDLVRQAEVSGTSPATSVSAIRRCIAGAVSSASTKGWRLD